MTSQTAAEEWAEIGGRFTSLVEGADPARWDSPAPVAGWTARDVVRHLVEWFPGFLASGSGERLEVATSVDEDPVAAWHELAGGVRALLDDPARAGKVLSNPHVGDVPLDRAVSQFFTADVFMHSWDLATATGQAHGLDPDRATAMLAGMVPMEQVLRDSGQYGPAVEVADDADPVARLMGFIGRDPDFTPET
jgi:uncharacterized protein (TIGR03086 family)